jgi:hypothetical protein
VIRRSFSGGAVARPREEHVLDSTIGSRQGPPRICLTPQCFKGQEGMRQHHHRHVMVRAIPAPFFE